LITFEDDHIFGIFNVNENQKNEIVNFWNYAYENNETKFDNAGYTKKKIYVNIVNNFLFWCLHIHCIYFCKRSDNEDCEYYVPLIQNEINKKTRERKFLLNKEIINNLNNFNDFKINVFNNCDIVLIINELLENDIKTGGTNTNYIFLNTYPRIILNENILKFFLSNNKIWTSTKKMLKKKITKIYKYKDSEFRFFSLPIVIFKHIKYEMLFLTDTKSIIKFYCLNEINFDVFFLKKEIEKENTKYDDIINKKIIMKINELHEYNKILTIKKTYNTIRIGIWRL